MKATAGLVLCAAGAGALLGHGLLPTLQGQPGDGTTPGGSFALVRYEGWLRILWAHLVCLVAVAGVVR